MYMTYFVSSTHKCTHFDKYKFELLTIIM